MNISDKNCFNLNILDKRTDKKLDNIKYKKINLPRRSYNESDDKH